MNRTRSVLAAVATAAVAGVAFYGPGGEPAGAADGDAADPGADQPRAVCEARRVGQDVEVSVRLQLTQEQLDVTADGALAVVDLGTTTQTQPLRQDDRSDGSNYSVVFTNLPPDAAIESISVRASPSPDDPATFACDASSVLGPATDAVPQQEGNLPAAGA